MNKKLKELWQKTLSKIPWFKQEAPPVLVEQVKVAPPIYKGTWTPDEIEQIAAAMGNDDDNYVLPPSESPAQYGVHPGILSDYRRKIGGKQIETSTYYKKDGIILGYTSKVKRNNGTIETVSILTAEEAEKLAADEQKAREAAMGFPPRCPECKVLLPEGSVLGMGKSSFPNPPQQPYQLDSEFSDKEMAYIDDLGGFPKSIPTPAKVIKVTQTSKRRKSRRKK